MRGIISAMREHCSGAANMCHGFTSLPAKEMDTFYEETSFQTLLYASGFELPYRTYFDENRRLEGIHYNAWQIRRFQDNSTLRKHVSSD